MPAGRYEALPLPGTRQQFDTEPVSNLVLQNPTYIKSNTTVKFWQPFVISYAASAETSSAQVNTDIYTCPTGYKVRVFDAMVVARNAESSATVQLRNNTTAIFTAIAAATDQAVTRPTAGFDDAAYELTAGQKLNVLSAGGTNGPAFNIYAWCGLMPA